MLMADDRSILFADLEHAAARRDPQFGSVLDLEFI